MLHTAITFHHFLTVSLWAQNLPFQKILSSTLVCFCLSDWSHGSRPFTGFICSSVLRVSFIFFCFSYPYVRQIKLASSLVNFWAHYKIVWLIDWLLLTPLTGTGQAQTTPNPPNGGRHEGERALSVSERIKDPIYVKGENWDASSFKSPASFKCIVYIFQSPTTCYMIHGSSMAGGKYPSGRMS